MALISLRDVMVSFGGSALLEDVNLHIEKNERVCLVGRNGAGKTTLMRLIFSQLDPDAGQIMRQQGLRVARLEQEVPRGLEGSVFQITADGLGEVGKQINEYHRISATLGSEDDAERLRELEEVEKRLHISGGWTMHQQVEAVISRMELDPESPVSQLSAGMKRRVMLARALVSDPHLLLLDEPTNHLDIQAIEWMEKFLLRYEGTLLFVTHDRRLVERLATRIVEIDRAQVSSWACDFDTYQKRKAAALEAQAAAEALFDKRLAQEEVWIRKGIQARRTRNEGRVRQLEKMREIRKARRTREGVVKMGTQDVAASGRIVFEAINVAFGWSATPNLIHDFSSLILRGDKIGIIGPNGSGKTTLLRLILGELKQTAGKIKRGANVEVAYFDQLHAQLDDAQSVAWNVNQGHDSVVINGRNRHVISYLEDFLFSPERSRSPVSRLSGGERNRLLLARMFSRPANVLVLDEPTNDLDYETLELLEELLLDYAGTVLLVSHDRAFLNHVVTSTLVLEGDGRVKEYAGGYDDWVRTKQAQQAARLQPPPPAPQRKDSPIPKSEPAASQASKKTTKLSFREQREREQLPQRIEQLEQEQRQLHATLSDPTFYRNEGPEIARITARSAEVDGELETAYERWAELEERAGG